MEGLIVASIPKKYNIQLINNEIIFLNKNSLKEYINLKKPLITTIDDVKEQYLESTISYILKSNNNLLIDRIVYSEDENQLIFIADKKIDLKSYNLANLIYYSYYDYGSGSNVSNLLNEITFIHSNSPHGLIEQNRLMTKHETYKDYISVYNLFAIINRIATLYYNLEEVKETYIKDKNKDLLEYHKEGKDFFYSKPISLVDVDYEDYLNDYNCNKIYYYAKEPSLLSDEVKKYVSPVYSPFSYEHYESNLVRELYSISTTYIDFDLFDAREFKHKTEDKIIKVSNNCFCLSISKKSLKLYNENDLCIEMPLPFTEFICSSNNYKDFVMLKENCIDILKNSYVNISDCPKYLDSIRKEDIYLYATSKVYKSIDYKKLRTEIIVPFLHSYPLYQEKYHKIFADLNSKLGEEIAFENLYVEKDYSHYTMYPDYLETELEENLIINKKNIENNFKRGKVKSKVRR